jgi:hypothetical protein
VGVIRTAVSTREDVIDDEPVRATRTMNLDTVAPVEMCRFAIWCRAAFLAVKSIADKNKANQGGESRRVRRKLPSRSRNTANYAITINPTIWRRLRNERWNRLIRNNNWTQSHPKMLRAKNRLQD